MSDRLMEVSVPVWNNSDCEQLYVQTIHETNVCAGGENGKDSCKVRFQLYDDKLGRKQSRICA